MFVKGFRLQEGTPSSRTCKPHVSLPPCAESFAFGFITYPEPQTLNPKRLQIADTTPKASLCGPGGGG